MMDPRTWVRNVGRAVVNFGSVVVWKFWKKWKCLQVSGIINKITSNYDLAFRLVYPSISSTVNSHLNKNHLRLPVAKTTTYGLETIEYSLLWSTLP